MPLTGTKVVDLTRVLAGPFCTALLGDMGAEVIKIETPGKGDPVRNQGAFKNGLSYYYALFNRNKKSLTLNLRTEKGKEILTELIKRSDVVVENFRPGVMEKMGFGYPRLKELKPDIVYCGVTGFGKDGPYKDRPAFDFIAQGMSGLMSLNNKEGEDPMRVAMPVSDQVAGLYAAFGIVSALLHRAKTGEGQEVQTSLVDGLVSFLAYISANYFATNRLPLRTGNDHPIVSPYGMFRAKDGGYVGIAPSYEEIYQRLLTALDIEHLRDDPEFATNDLRMKNRDKINAIIRDKIKEQPRDHWIEHLNKSGVPCGPIQDLDEVFTDPQILHQQMAVDVEHPGHGSVRMTGFPVKLSQTPCAFHRPAPKIGEHTKEILDDLGILDKQQEKLKKQGVI